MPTLPLPTGGTLPAGGDLPVVDSDDVLARFPALVNRKDSAPVRDGLVAALTQVMLTYQERAGFALAQADVLDAIGDALVEIGSKRGVFRAPGESDFDYRTRILTIPSMVTPAAILAAADAILAPYTTVKSQYSESISDRWYLGKHTSPRAWHSYVWQGTTSRAPSYPDRFYKDDAAANAGEYRAQSDPGGARLFRDPHGRRFTLRIPVLRGISEAGAFVRIDPAITPGHFAGGMFLYQHATVSVAENTFVRRSSASAHSIVEAIVNVINRIKGHGVRWILEADPKLT
jgi:hypothetical protein